jgi:RHH-type proline utilization regulon transcriptional repressor/proline dehydrogenase/delta 1-pyrroline-5-carboxylate dehydrogenase
VLFEGDGDDLLALCQIVAARSGPIIGVQGAASGVFDQGAGELSSAALAEPYALERLVTERSVSVNTAAAGGNASLMTIG